jgi:hypothetical protein
VTLVSGSVVEVWADGYEDRDGCLVFTALIDADRPPEDSTLVVNRTPSDPLRVDVAVERFRRNDVADVESA